MTASSGSLPVSRHSVTPFNIGAPPKSPPDWEEIAEDFDRLHWNQYRPREKSKAEEIAPGIFRILVPQAFYADTNAYLIMGDEPALVDPGHAYPESTRSLVNGLRALGLEPSDLTRVVLTHPHVDHAAGCVPLWSAYRIPVAAHPGTGEQYVDFARLIESAYERYRPRAPHLLNAGFLPEEVVTFPRLYYLPPGPIGYSEPLPERGRIKMGSRNWDIFFTPGHSDQHILLVDPEGIALSGDLFIGKTTSLGRIGVYLETLDTISSLRLNKLLPAHGSPIAGPSRRIQTARSTITRRRDKALELLGGPGLTVTGLARALLGDIPKIHLASAAVAKALDLLDELISDGCVGILRGGNPADPAQNIYRKK